MRTPVLLVDCFSGVRIGGGTQERSLGRQLLAHREYRAPAIFLSRVFLYFFYSCSQRIPTLRRTFAVQKDTHAFSLPFFPQSLVYTPAPHRTACGALPPHRFPQAEHSALRFSRHLNSFPLQHSHSWPCSSYSLLKDRPCCAILPASPNHLRPRNLARLVQQRIHRFEEPHRMRQSRVLLQSRLVHPPRMNKKQPPVPHRPERVKLRQPASSRVGPVTSRSASSTALSSPSRACSRTNVYCSMLPPFHDELENCYPLPVSVKRKFD